MHKKSLGSVSNTGGMNGAIQIQLHFIYLAVYHSSGGGKKKNTIATPTSKDHHQLHHI